MKTYKISYPEDQGVKYESFRYPAGEIQIRIKPEELPKLQKTQRLVVMASSIDGEVMGLALLTDALFSQVPVNNAGLIYGDSINVERADKILHRALCQGFSPYNFVFGIGSYTYQYVTRDTYNFAMKATAVRRNGKVEAIFKDPVTDNAHKKSHRGIPIPYDTPNGLEITETTHPELLGQCAFRTVFSNGRLLIDQDFSIIRQRVREGL